MTAEAEVAEDAAIPVSLYDIYLDMVPLVLNAWSLSLVK